MKLDMMWARRLGRMTLMALGTAAMLAACGGNDGGSSDDDGDSAVCGDDQVNGGDQCDGADFGGATCASLGFAEGTLSCNSCVIDTTQCIALDADGDGVFYADELALGLDPDNPDTDTDGIWDGIELQNGSDPLNVNSWPQGQGLWPNRLASAVEDGVTESGWGSDQTLWNFGWTDQFGNFLQLHQFYGYVIVMSLGARWCGPCQQAASTSQFLWDEHREDGVIFIEVLIDGLQPGVNATQNDIETWVNSYQLQYPVVWNDMPLSPPAVPTYHIINRDLSVVESIPGFPGDAQLTSLINQYK